MTLHKNTNKNQPKTNQPSQKVGFRPRKEQLDSEIRFFLQKYKKNRMSKNDLESSLRAFINELWAIFDFFTNLKFDFTQKHQNGSAKNNQPSKKIRISAKKRVIYKGLVFENQRRLIIVRVFENPIMVPHLCIKWKDDLRLSNRPSWDHFAIPFMPSGENIKNMAN